MLPGACPFEHVVRDSPSLAQRRRRRAHRAAHVVVALPHAALAAARALEARRIGLGARLAAAHAGAGLAGLVAGRLTAAVVAGPLPVGAAARALEAGRR